MFTSLRWKLAIPVLLLTGSVFALFAWLSVERLEHTVLEREVVELDSLARSLAWDPTTVAAVDGGDRVRLESRISEMLVLKRSLLRIEVFRLDARQRARLVATEGSVSPGFLRGTSTNGATWEGTQLWERGDRDGVLAIAHIHDFAPDLGDAVGEVDPGPQKTVGLVRLWASREPVRRAVADFLDRVLPWSVALLFAVTIFILVITSRVLSHLATLAAAADYVGQGNSGTTVEVPGRDEIASLSLSFNAMSRRLERSKRLNEEHQRTLEAKVEERTKELRLAYNELRKLDKAKDSLLSTVSHELRTPLTSIRSFAEILIEYGDQELPEQRKEFLGIIKSESERLTRLVSQALDLAKIEAGKVEWQLEKVDLRRLAAMTIRTISGLSREKQVDFELETELEELPYEGDRDKLFQVLTNLLSNAWKFSPEGAAVKLVLDEEEGWVQFRVEDRGPGIPDAEDKELVFARFVQVGDPLLSKPHGTGLGLSICREIIIMHGGTVHCEDNPDGGAVFVVRLAKRGKEPRPIDEAVEARLSGRIRAGLDDDPKRSLWSAPAVQS